ncbi:flagellar motor switch phosphatase FliY [Gorillibacterium massiliense]|uniref:flagellar motor switch phosphatase FliY n=1 Tax=Gorillibacterium massiliense TaxID=1280390 RepID=UPI0004B3CA6B|nr:flagellar motor switch phosphatase FliY [Gorillibacterium massiliense]
MTNNRDYLSQEEIDALLKQTSDVTEEDSFHETPDVSEYLSSLEQDALGEIGNITFGSAATALSTLLGKKVEITTPKVSVLLRQDLPNEFPKPHVTVHVNYVDGFHGINLLVIQTKDAKVIANLMMGGDGTGTEVDELTEIHLSAVQEAMNQMMGSSATSMSTIFNRLVNISPPGIDIVDLSSGNSATVFSQEEVYVKISFRLKIGDLIDSTIMQLLPVPFSRELVLTLMGGEEPDMGTGSTPDKAPEAPVQTPVASKPEPRPAAAEPSYPPQSRPAQPMLEPHGNPPTGVPAYPGYPVQPEYPMPSGYGYQQPAAYGGMPNRNVNVQQAQFANFNSGLATAGEETNLNLLLDIPLKVTVELGRSKMLIKDILQLSQGSIIELDKLAGEPVDILVNNKLIAKGEVVVIDENFGVRVTDIINQWERIQKLQ